MPRSAGPSATLHARGCFVIPNPYDVGGGALPAGARLQGAGDDQRRRGLALGFPDGGRRRDAMLDHIAAIVAATDVPVNADFGNGFADEPEDVAANVDALRRDRRRRPLDRGRDGRRRTAALRSRRSRSSGSRRRARRSTLPAATSSWSAGRSASWSAIPMPLQEALRRLERFAEAGADCLYAPGVRQREDIAAIVKAVAPKPVNVLVGGPIGPDASPTSPALGVRRVSVGGALARVAWGGFMRAAREIAEKGSFRGLRRGDRPLPRSTASSRKIRSGGRRVTRGACDGTADGRLGRSDAGGAARRRWCSKGRFCRIEKLDPARHGDALVAGGQGRRPAVDLYGLRAVRRRQGVRRLARRAGRARSTPTPTR